MNCSWSPVEDPLNSGDISPLKAVAEDTNEQLTPSSREQVDPDN